MASFWCKVFFTFEAIWLCLIYPQRYVGAGPEHGARTSQLCSNFFFLSIWRIWLPVCHNKLVLKFYFLQGTFLADRALSAGQIKTKNKVMVGNTCSGSFITCKQSVIKNLHKCFPLPYEVKYFCTIPSLSLWQGRHGKRLRLEIVKIKK